MRQPEIRAPAAGRPDPRRRRRAGTNRPRGSAARKNARDHSTSTATLHDCRRGAPVISHFQFQYPWLLALLALLPVYAVLRGRAGKLSALKFPSADLARAAGGAARSAAGSLLVFLRLLTVGLCILAIAVPRFANERTETQASGVDIMLVLDLSWSMMSLDMGGHDESGTRFGIASSVLEDFVSRRPNDRIGLEVFSGVPYLASPLTLNHDWVIQNLHRVHIGTIRELGTAIGDA